jgi:hypothetical protein
MLVGEQQHHTGSAAMSFANKNLMIYVYTMHR